MDSSLDVDSAHESEPPDARRRQTPQLREKKVAEPGTPLFVYYDVEDKADLMFPLAANKQDIVTVTGIHSQTNAEEDTSIAAGTAITIDHRNIRSESGGFLPEGEGPDDHPQFDDDKVDPVHKKHKPKATDGPVIRSTPFEKGRIQLMRNNKVADDGGPSIADDGGPLAKADNGDGRSAEIDEWGTDTVLENELMDMLASM